jgi:hypothetical protein
VAGEAEVTALAGKGQKVFVIALLLHPIVVLYGEFMPDKKRQAARVPDDALDDHLRLTI